MVDYGLLPPEINSGRIYAGPGAGSFAAAAAAWGELATEFQVAATGHRSVIEVLTSGPWLGPASAQLISAVSPFIAWLSNSAEQAARTSTQAGAAASAYETAFMASVPPPLIAANRALVQELIATNMLGQNSAAISRLESLYAEYWAQDSGAMYTYANSSAAATQLTELSAPAEVADPMGAADQAIAGFKAQFNNINGSITGVGAQINPRVSEVLKTLAAPINGPAIDAWLMANTPFDDIVPIYSKYISPYINSVAALTQSTQTIGQNASGFSGIGGLANTLTKDAATAASKAAEAAAGAGKAAAGAAAGAAANGIGGISGVAAGLGKAIPIGGLSAPAGWVPWHATTNPGVASAIPAAAQGSNGFPIAQPFGQFGNGGYGRNQPTYGFKPSVMAKPPAAG